MMKVGWISSASVVSSKRESCRPPRPSCGRYLAFIATNWLISQSRSFSCSTVYCGWYLRIASTMVRRSNGLPSSMFVALIGDRGRAGGSDRGVADQRLGEVHQVAVIAIGLVELHHGELGVVPGRQAFVAEIAVDLEHLLEAADHQTLEIQLRCDAQEQLHVERVVVGGEGLRRGAAGDGVHHRRFDFEKVALDHEGANGLDDLRAAHEGLARVRRW